MLGSNWPSIREIEFFVRSIRTNDQKLKLHHTKLLTRHLVQSDIPSQSATSFGSCAVTRLARDTCACDSGPAFSMSASSRDTEAVVVSVSSGDEAEKAPSEPEIAADLPPLPGARGKLER